jgi:hypothetical protein
LARVPWALAEEDDEGGSEMERREKSSIAFFDGLSLISSPYNRADRGKNRISKDSMYFIEWKISRRKWWSGH